MIDWFDMGFFINNIWSQKPQFDRLNSEIKWFSSDTLCAFLSLENRMQIGPYEHTRVENCRVEKCIIAIVTIFPSEFQFEDFVFFHF